jgi:hypothetical protein
MGLCGPTALHLTAIPLHSIAAGKLDRVCRAWHRTCGVRLRLSSAEVKSPLEVFAEPKDRKRPRACSRVDSGASSRGGVCVEDGKICAWPLAAEQKPWLGVRASGQLFRFGGSDHTVTQKTIATELSLVAGSVIFDNVGMVWEEGSREPPPYPD